MNYGIMDVGNNPVKRPGDGDDGPFSKRHRNEEMPDYQGVNGTRKPSYTSGAGAGMAKPHGSQSLNAGGAGGGIDGQETDQLQDALTSFGFNLKEEEMNLSTSLYDASNLNTFALTTEDRSRKSDFLNSFALIQTVNRIVSMHRLKGIDPEIHALISMSARDYLANLIQKMMVESNHRTTVVDTKRLKQIDNVRQTLASIAHKEYESEERRRAVLNIRRAEHEARLAEMNAANNGEDGSSSRRRKEQSSAAAAKNISEDAQNRMTNATASIMAGSALPSGGKKYSWMATDMTPITPAIGGGFGIRKKDSASHKMANLAKDGTLPVLHEEQNLVTMRDALAVLEMDREGAGRVFGRGARAMMRGYIRLKD
ncbi:transcription factor TFIID complex subunit Taf4 [Schizosaccharomyces japonicus yFS275]|uniref:Transcription initiation factor TFIID subunit 4 n=1 Tax=Schizosaccharomyces japonicus (strain yFS275 / FY16936) TaxID=402676 RepID=B6JWG5_SCHJY|nr:transcription factor TFIID complex subunit Taf4 [Schizosaccharomyces japonicus yFS275]EEB05716.2 transcription factor TFIID complex subunit Taf4 [Schizosaccharomyces japonicus yFS275]